MAEPFLTGILTEHTADNWRNLSRVQAGSLAFHLAVLGLLLIYTALQIQELPLLRTPLGPLIFAGHPPPQKVVKKNPGGGGDGGTHNSIPPTRGNTGPFAWIQFAPATPTQNSAPRLAVQPNVVGPPEMKPPEVDAKNWGSPLLRDFTNSGGPGEGGGTGNGCCGGVGPGGRGRGIGPGEEWGIGGGTPQAGTRLTSHPVCEYCPNPGYTEEARKVKFNGSVLLRVVITVDGRATNIRVIKGAGMGLDERAMEAVAGWKFRPSLGRDGRPVETWTEIEINFRIY